MSSGLVFRISSTCDLGSIAIQYLQSGLFQRRKTTGCSSGVSAVSRYFGPAEVSAAAAAAADAAALYFGIWNLVDSIGNPIWDGIWQYLMVFRGI